MALIVDIVEPQDGIVFVTGYATTGMTVDDRLCWLRVFEPAKKRKQSPKKVAEIAVSLSIANMIVEGEPLETIAAEHAVQVGLSGDVAPLLNILQEHHWHHSNGRYHLPRKETRFIMLSGD